MQTFTITAEIYVTANDVEEAAAHARNDISWLCELDNNLQAIHVVRASVNAFFRCAACGAEWEDAQFDPHDETQNCECGETCEAIP